MSTGDCGGLTARSHLTGVLSMGLDRARLTSLERRLTLATLCLQVSWHHLTGTTWPYKWWRFLHRRVYREVGMCGQRVRSMGVRVFLFIITTVLVIINIVKSITPTLPNPPLNCVNLLLLRFASGIRFSAAFLII